MKKLGYVLLFIFDMVSSPIFIIMVYSLTLGFLMYRTIMDKSDVKETFITFNKQYFDFINRIYRNGIKVHKERILEA